MPTSNVRAEIERTLALIADRDAQFQLQAQTPTMDVSTELFLQWEDTYRPRSRAFASAFDPSEFATLRAFHTIFVSVRDQVLFHVPPLDRFVDTAPWQRYSDAARVALGRLRAALRAA